MKQIGDLAYAVARIHSIERQMLSDEALMRIVDSKDIDEAYKIISDFGYQKQKDAFQIDDVLKNEKEKTFSLIKKIVDEAMYFDIFLLEVDYHNLKVLFKNERVEENYEHLLLEGGIYTKVQIQTIFRDREFAKFNETMQLGVERVMEMLGKTNDPQIVDVILDQAYYEDIMIRAKFLQSEFLTRFVQMRIDVTNIKSFLRSLKLKLGVDFIQKMLMKNGTIPISLFVEQITNSIDQIESAFRYTSYGLLIEEGLKRIQKKDSLAYVEKMIDDMIIQSIKGYKYQAFGIEPIFAYIIGKEYEMKNIRMAFSSVVNGISHEKTKERLRMSYV